MYLCIFYIFFYLRGGIYLVFCQLNNCKFTFLDCYQLLTIIILIKERRDKTPKSNQILFWLQILNNDVKIPVPDVHY